MSALSDLIFPSQESNINNNNINRILGDLKRSNLSITNRLRSIREDAEFVEGVGAALGGRRPLVANERCGSWYIRPALKGASAYFKSTDGHTGQWKFSARRLNLHLLPVIEEHDGIIIVDSTRRGKRMPDSLSKTIPIWCCVLNRVLFPDQADFHGLYVPPNVVSDSEKSQMLSQVPGFVESFKELNLDPARLRAQISKPLRPTWVTQETELGRFYQEEEEQEEEQEGRDGGAVVSSFFEDFRPIICCTSSRRVTDGEMSGHSGYVQGAGDDTENWALGLTPPVFWQNADRLLSAPEADLPALIRALVAAPPAAVADATQQGDAGGGGGGGETSRLPSALRQLTPYLYVCPLPIPQSLPSQEDIGGGGGGGEGGDAARLAWCKVALSSATTPPETWVRSADLVDAGLGKHKAASRNLRGGLATICDFVSRFLRDDDETTGGENEKINNDENADADAQAQPLKKPLRKRVVIADESDGKDLAIGVALALICCCFSDEEGHVLREAIQRGGGGGDGREVSFNKTMIKVRLGRIMTTMPDANPNRATLQSVNSFLMDWR